MKILIAAAFVAPMDQPIIRDGGVVFENGTIVAVGEEKPLRAAHPDAQLENLGEAVVLPGLVNPHTHLELSHCTPGDAGEPFIDWIIKLADRSGRNSGVPHEQLYGNATRIGIEVAPAMRAVRWSDQIKNKALLYNSQQG